MTRAGDRASRLERWLGRVFGDDEPTSVGSGWIAGTASVFLGFVAVLGALAFWFPGLFTTAEFRGRYPVAALRALLEFTIGLTFLLGAASVMMRRRKVLGLTGMGLYAYLVFVSFHAVFIHANVRFRFGWIDRVIATPRGHHWHHAPAPVDKNFAVHLPAIDWLFGTQHLPADAWPEAYGIAGDPVPEGYLRQLAHPFRRSDP